MKILSALKRRMGAPSLDASADAERLLQAMPEPFRGRLLSMYRNEPQHGTNGALHPMDGLTKVPPDEGLWLYHFCLQHQPSDTLEIGLAYGFSTIYFLAALSQYQAGTHTAIDAFHDTWWGGIGAEHGRSLDAARFTFLAERSAAALSRFAGIGRQFSLIFIDGDHRFDAALMDVTLSAELCPIGGHLVLDDLWMPSLRRVAAFMKTNRLDFARVPTPIANIALYQRVSADTREWMHFVDFK